ncbi:MAG: endolytic transglycosylase MltG [Ruminococcaceae bacterium]|nr:endolytic transglycosylase MltG [Oscillospiraceae bacterium]
MSKEKKSGLTQPIKNDKVLGEKKENSEASLEKQNSQTKKWNKSVANDGDKTKVRKKTEASVELKGSAENELSEKKEEKIPVVVEAPKKPRKKYGNSSFSAIVKTVSYIGIVLVVSVVLAVVIILAANDVFAFTKSDAQITVVIDEYPNIDTIAEALADANVIKYPSLFKLYAKLKEKENYNFAKGTYTVSPSMNYDALLIAFVPEKAARQQISITIPEGYSVDEIIDLFVSKGIGTRDEFIDVVNNYEFDYWFLEDLECSEDRIYRLEGYLYPDTYYFWSDSSEVAAISKLLSNFKNKFKKSWLKRCDELGMTMDEVLTLASMIQEEARYPEDYPYVSSVFHNRLKSEEFGGFLQSDATVQYFYRNVYGSIKDPFTDADRKFKCAYNTYIHEGLPPSPLSTPTIDAINSAMYPAESNYHYFVTDSLGYCMFAVTYEEHKMNIAAIEAGQTAKDDDDQNGDDVDNGDGDDIDEE